MAFNLSRNAFPSTISDERIPEKNINNISAICFVCVFVCMCLCVCVCVLCISSPFLHREKNLFHCLHTQQCNVSPPRHPNSASHCIEHVNSDFFPWPSEWPRNQGPNTCGRVGRLTRAVPMPISNGQF